MRLPNLEVLWYNGFDKRVFSPICLRMIRMVLTVLPAVKYRVISTTPLPEAWFSLFLSITPTFLPFVAVIIRVHFFPKEGAVLIAAQLHKIRITVAGFTVLIHQLPLFSSLSEMQDLYRCVPNCLRGSASFSQCALQDSNHRSHS